ncbi:hypothetical protein [Dyella japonica]|uniref:Antitoxin Xre/MbcA/ParS-like toxin-binding domain-containing protein n=1 Tax=Dyella japonica A8 TaxID=1217721 RepID=A0A075K3A8_9GAMM|nr:hypothetical protein [Dyella japonica]AIF48182.1 hypothetical protein HY57_13395 [Dyella japonica A8]
MAGIHSNTPIAKSSLQSQLLAAYAADPLDKLISPVGEHSYSTLFSLIPVSLAVLRVAAEIEPEPAAVMEWYQTTPIEELGHLTAEQLVALGRAEVVIGFLLTIRDGTRT